MLETTTAWAINAPADDFWKISAFLVATSLFGFGAAFYYLIRARIIQDIPTSKVRSASQGYTELKGRSDHLTGTEIRGPLTGKTCTWYSYTIEQYRRSGKRSRWITVEKGESDELFLLIDETGQAVIDPEGAEVTHSTKDVWYGHARFPEHRPGAKKRAWFHLGPRRYRYTEKRMHPGDPLYAIGLFMTRGGDRTNLNVNNDVRDLLREWKQQSEALLEKHDLDKNGKLDINEWESVRKSALEQVLARHAELRRTPAVHTMGKTGDLRRPYLLSAVPEPGLVKRLVLYARLGIAGFFLGGIPAVWLITTRLSQ